MQGVRRRLGRWTTNPDFELMRLLGRFTAAREASRWFHPAVAAEEYLRRPTLFPDLDANQVVAALDRTGYCPGLRLPAPVRDEIVAYAQATPCYGNWDPRYGFHYRDRAAAQARVPQTRFLIGQFFNASVDCAPVRQLKEDGVLWAIAARYLRARPVLQGVNLWWSFAVEADAADRNLAAQMYHFDVDDYRFLKFFFYLTDVDADGGPHAMVAGTHARKRLVHQLTLRRYGDAEIEAAYGAERVIMIYGEAGTGFAEDTGCFHKGIPPRTRDRLALQVEFALHDYALAHDERPPAQLRMIL